VDNSSNRRVGNKATLHRSYVEDTVAKGEDEHIKKGLTLFSAEEAQLRMEHYLGRIQYKLTKVTYASFTRYFGHLKRLG
jgi:hypothetical protein